MGGSYVEDASQSMNGELLIPIANGAFMRLHMSEVPIILLSPLVTIRYFVSVIQISVLNFTES